MGTSGEGELIRYSMCVCVCQTYRQSGAEHMFVRACAFTALPLSLCIRSFTVYRSDAWLKTMCLSLPNSLGRPTEMPAFQGSWMCTV